MSSRKARLAEVLRRVWSESEVEAVGTNIADSYTIHNDPGVPWHGETLTRDVFAKRLVASGVALPDQVRTPLSVIEEGDRIAGTWS